jgi:ABC-type transport system substrate-binding protein
MFSCTKKTDSDKTLHVPLSGEISTLDPAHSYDTISASVVYQGYEQLFEYHYLKRPYTLKPLLAESMPIIENDGTKYTIKIRKNIQYHDDPSFNGKPRFLIANDFINQFKRLAFIPTKSNGWWLFDGKVKGINEFRKKAKTLKDLETINIEGLYATDDHTLVIELSESYPQLIYALAMSFTSPMPIEPIRKYKNILNDKIIGTGPFKLDSWVRSSTLKLSKFENFHKNFYPGSGDRLANSRGLLKDSGKLLPFLEKIQFHIIKEAQTRWLNFKKAKVHFLNIPKDNYATAIEPSGQLSKELIDSGIKLEVFPTLTYWWISFNMKDPILGKNLNLRKAIAHAVDVDKYIRIFTNNTGQKANSIYPPGIPGFDPTRELPYNFDLIKAANYLEKAGYPKGKGLPALVYDVRGASATNKQQADYVKQQLSKIGIKVKINLNTFPGFLEKARNGKLQFWQDGWAMDYPDSENSLQLLTSKNHAPGPNSTFYSNKDYDNLYNQLKLLSDGDKKRSLMLKMEELVHKDLPWVMQYYSRNYILIHETLKNYRHSDLIYNNYKYLKLGNN